jgi:hypothetical protein
MVPSSFVRGLLFGLTARPIAAHSPRSHHAPRPIEVVELRDAILRTIVEKFGDRPLSWKTAEQALADASFEVKIRLSGACYLACERKVYLPACYETPPWIYPRWVM